MTWQSHRVCLVRGIADTRHQKHVGNDKFPQAGNPYDTIALGQVWNDAAFPQTCAKHSTNAILPSTYNQPDAREHAAQREHGKFVVVAADVDQNPPSLSAVCEAVEAITGGSAAICHTTPSATPESPRSRVLVPLHRPLTFAAWTIAQQAFQRALADYGIETDLVLERCGQVMFLPNNHGGYYEFACLDGPSFLSGDVPSTIKAHGAQIRFERQQEAQLDAKRQAEARRKMDSHKATSGEESPIAWFNRCHDLEVLLIGFGYKREAQKSTNWQSPFQTSGSFATSVAGGKWASLSESDAGAGLGSAINGSRCGDAFDLWRHFEHGGDFTRAVREAGEMMRKNSKNKGRRANGAR